MKILFITEVTFLVVGFLFSSCAVPSGVEKGEHTKPEITLRIASLNLGNINRRIEKNDIGNLVKTLKAEKIEVFAVQDIIRYPGVSSRVDFVNELSKQTEWQNAFGEMANISGRQTGNAVFSSYPIVSYHNQIFDNFQSVQFESALETIVDAGVRTITVISTHFPAKLTIDERSQCLKQMLKSTMDRNGSIAIITGNLPLLGTAQSEGSFNMVTLPKSVNKSVPEIWYSRENSIRLIGSHITELEIGRLIIIEIGLFK